MYDENVMWNILLSLAYKQIYIQIIFPWLPNCNKCVYLNSFFLSHQWSKLIFKLGMNMTLTLIMWYKKGSYMKKSTLTWSFFANKTDTSLGSLMSVIHLPFPLFTWLGRLFIWHSNGTRNLWPGERGNNSMSTGSTIETFNV